MTLSRKLGLQISALIAAIVMTGGASLWGLAGLGQYYNETVDTYEQLRGVYEIGHYAASAQTSLNQADYDTALSQISKAIRSTEPVFEGTSQYDSEEQLALQAAIADMRTSLQKVQEAIRAESVSPSSSTAISQSHYELNAMLNRVAQVAGRTKNKIISDRQKASARYQTTVLMTAGLALLTVLGAVMLGVVQYRNIMRQIIQLKSGMKRIADSQFSEVLSEQGDREFADLAAEFNRMAKELDSLYRQMEQKIAMKSKELVRSERLASVGYLAAGLAHELSNPLGIIAGHAEEQLENDDVVDTAEYRQQQREVLNIICEESFRCKEIIQQLLSLAVGESDDNRRQPCPLGEVAKEVVALTTAHKQHRSKKVHLDVDSTEDVSVQANRTEIKHVMMNLVINALEAVSPETGQVWIDCRRRDRWVEFLVRDDGCGLSPEALDRVFEPFYTTKHQTGRRGMGLGLSVSHAIIQSYGGTIEAQSDGEGRGTRFTIQLPITADAAEV